MKATKIPAWPIFLVIVLLAVFVVVVFREERPPAYVPLPVCDAVCEFEALQAARFWFGVRWVVLLGLAGFAALWLYHYHHDRHAARRRLPLDLNGRPALIDPLAIGQLLGPAAAREFAGQLYAGFFSAEIERAHALRQVPANYSPSLTVKDPAGRALAAPAEALALAADAPALPGVIDLADDLESGRFRPSFDRLLLAYGAGREAIAVGAESICHVAGAGATGAGKSNIKRLLLGQWLALGLRAVLVDPKFAPVDVKSGEDWRPIVDRLYFQPAVKATEIAALIDWAHDELERRIECRNGSRFWGDPLLLSIDELPEVLAGSPGLAAKLTRIGRLGRALDLFLEVSGQDFLAATVKDSAMRKNFLTTFYLGGDLRTGSVLLDLDQKSIAGQRLGLGVAWLRSVATSPAEVVRVPLMSNRALYNLLPGDYAATLPAIMAAARADSGPILDIAPAAPAAAPAGLVRPGDGLVAASDDQAASALESADRISPEAIRAARLFFVDKKGQSEIVAALRGIDSKQARRYQIALGEISELIRIGAPEVLGQR